MNRSFMTRVLCHRAERARSTPQEPSTAVTVANLIGV